MALTSHQHEPDPQQYPRLSPDEQRIANAVVAALRPELKTITDTQEQHTKILSNLQQEMRGVNRILAGAGLIIDDPDI